ncbi:C6 finger domain containing protein [Colletotrichum tabaci]|uniref:C6 finger domain containing protein n=1 Tax=Colletotrichum tabaci TaxID=1209068 RepID=A0AAV9TIW0_9PEZI
MRPTRYSTSRQKACQRCASSKIKCDRKAGTCSRCRERGVACVYLQSQASAPSGPDATGLCDRARAGLAVSRNLAVGSEGANTHPREAQQEAALGSRPGLTETILSFRVPTPERPETAEIGLLPSRQQHGASTTGSSIPARSASRPSDGLDFSHLELVCPINADDIANRWLHNFVPVPGQVTKDYTPRVSAFIHRMLKSYANSSIRGRRVPPFVHWSQLHLNSSTPLSTCLSSIRVCDDLDYRDSKVSAERLQKEMATLFARRETEDDMALLATFQAHLVYSLVTFFRLEREAHSLLPQIMMNTQELACAAARKGLACVAEQDGARPTWESWIAAEAKRRTLFTMCLLDSALLTHDGLPTHLATELRGLSAPASKSLWESRSRLDWQVVYDAHLAEWPEGGLRIDELWPMPGDLSEGEVDKRRSRVDAWLEDLDEFGTMIYAVTSGTHGT